MNKQIFIVAAAIIAALGLTTTTIEVNAALPGGCTGNPHDRDSGPVGNPHDPSANGAASGFETGNPHDAAAHGGPHHQEGPDICPGAQ